jgi:hypothetical protein
MHKISSGSCHVLSRSYFCGAKLQNVPEYLKWNIRVGVFCLFTDCQVFMLCE